MTAQLIHEAESTRQHARYKISARVVIDRESYEVNNWSVGGLSVKLPPELAELPRLNARLVFGFGSIDTSMDIELEKIQDNSKDKNIVGYRFIDLERSQLAVFHHVINAYLSGDIFDAGDIIQVIKKDAYAPKNQLKKKNKNGENGVFFTIRRIVGSLLIVATLVTLLGFIAYTVYHKVFIIESETASVNAPVVVVRAPKASYFEAFPVVMKGIQLKKGELLATLRLINGGAASIESPCDCEIITTHIPFKQFVDEGEPLLTLLPVDDRGIFIEAKFKNQDAEKLAVDQQVEISLINRQKVTGTITKILSGEAVEYKLSDPLRNVSSNPVSYSNVIIKPNSELDVDLIGTVASVSINTF